MIMGYYTIIPGENKAGITQKNWQIKSTESVVVVKKPDLLYRNAHSV